jgi:predicted neuraminidase
MRFILFLLSLTACAEPIFDTRLVFPMEHWHNHSSSVVQLPDGDLLVCWYNGSGERKADDVKIEAARLKKGDTEWGPRFVLADTPGFPDANPVVFVDQDQKFWLFWPLIIANEWHTAALQLRMTRSYPEHGAPVRWDRGEQLVFQPRNFELKVRTSIAAIKPGLDERWKIWADRVLERAGDKYFSRMGWMPRTHPVQLRSGRLILPLYSDGYDFSILAISDDRGATWFSSEPIVSAGGVQPSIVERKDGTLVAYMRDNGPAPQRVMVSESKDAGLTWGEVKDDPEPNPGSSVEVIQLRDGRWLMLNNDSARGRHTLVAALSADEGLTWKWRRHIEFEPREKGASRFHYPSVIQSADGLIHVTYSFFREDIPEGSPRKSIKHARFNTQWIEAGDPQ